MKRLDEYIENLYKNVDKNSKKISELKNEMKAHLLETVNELMEEGKSEEVSIEIALKRFGDAKQMMYEISNVMYTPKKFTKNILRTSIAFLIVGFLALMTLLLVNTYYEFIKSDMENKVFNIVKQDTKISSSTMNKLDSVMEVKLKALKLHNFAIFLKENNLEPNETDYTYSFKNAVYLYPREATVKEIIKPNGQKTISTNSSERNDSIYRLEWQYETSAPDYNFYSHLGKNIFLGCFIIYWVLYGIWAMLNISYKGKLNIVWIIAICLLNVIGYLAYRTTEKSFQGKLNE